MEFLKTKVQSRSEHGFQYLNLNFSHHEVPHITKNDFQNAGI